MGGLGRSHGGRDGARLGGCDLSRTGGLRSAGRRAESGREEVNGSQETRRTTDHAEAQRRRVKVFKKTFPSVSPRLRVIRRSPRLLRIAYDPDVLMFRVFRSPVAIATGSDCNTNDSSVLTSCRSPA